VAGVLEHGSGAGAAARRTEVRFCTTRRSSLPRKALICSANEDNPQIICDMPCPERDRVPPPEPTYADVRT